MNNTTFVHISDTHIGPPDTQPYGTDTAANLRHVAKRIQEMAIQPAFFVFSGDLSGKGLPESYEHLAQSSTKLSRHSTCRSCLGWVTTTTASRFVALC
jgi:3',5'-cyclic AMP phosphodiesterase CpdA